jgi:prepilin-type processing-associated H-X9-DG protein
MRLLFDEGYITDANLYSCPTGKPTDLPSDTTKGIAAVGCTATNTSYAYDPRHRTTHPASVAVMADKSDALNSTNNSPNHDVSGQNVLYIDGHVCWYARTACGSTIGVGPNQIFTNADDGGTSEYESVSHIMQ